jgi:hypothetical protein
MTTKTVECQTCKGKGGSVKTETLSGSGVGRKKVTRRTKCRYCKGSGVLTIEEWTGPIATDPRIYGEKAADTELDDWLL